MVLHNPNNWHWVDKNCIYWSREYFAEKLVGLKAEDAGKAEVAVSNMDKLEGDVDVCQRKGKVISLFDLNMELSFSGSVTGADDADDVPVAGRISIPEISYDSSEDDYNFTITVTDATPAKEPVKLLIRKQLVPKLRKALHQFGKDLIETHGKDIQHPETTVTSKPLGAPASSTTAAAAPEPKSSAAYNTSSLKLKPVFHAPAPALYDAFLKPEMVAAWTRSKPDIQAVEGSEYSLFGGNVSGKIVKLTTNERIEMTWRLRDWKKDHYAHLTLLFVAGPGETTLQVSWTGIPVGQEEVVENNFDEYYVKPIKVTFGFGAVL